MFDRSFEAEDNNPWATVRIAGAYLGVHPQQ